MSVSSPARESAVCRLSDLDDLQGIWVTAAGRRQARLVVAGNRFTFEFLDGDVYMGSFTLDPHDDPKRMDMRTEEGPAHHRGTTTYCIYSVSGGELRWCPSKPGSADRLYRFPAVTDDRHLSLVFHPLDRPGRK